MALGPARGQPPARPRRTAVLSRAAPGGNGGRRGAGCGPRGEHPFVPLLFRLLPSLGGVSERAEQPGREFGDGECAEFSPSRRCPLDEPSTSQPTSPINLAERLPTNLKPTTRSREGTSSPAGSPGSRKGKGKKEEKKKRKSRERREKTHQLQRKPSLFLDSRLFKLRSHRALPLRPDCPCSSLSSFFIY